MTMVGLALGKARALVSRVVTAGHSQ